MQFSHTFHEEKKMLLLQQKKGWRLRNSLEIRRSSAKSNAQMVFVKISPNNILPVLGIKRYVLYF